MGVMFQRGGMISRNFIVKNAVNFSEHNAKIFENSLPLPKNRRQTKNISLSYDVNDRIYLKSKSVQLRTDLAKIDVIQILKLSKTDLH